MLLLFFFVLWQLGIFTGVGKPAIYLYPEEDLDVSVRVELNGWMTIDEPPYGDGWRVHVTPGGKIDGRYDYLYYEALLKDCEKPSSGWLVEYTELDAWFEEYLPKLGLNDAEAAEFKEYWEEKLPAAKYYQIGLLSDEYLARDMKLIVEPEPDSEIRLIFYFKPLDEPMILEEPQMEQKERIGFTVVEWGGVIDLPLLERLKANFENLL